MSRELRGPNEKLGTVLALAGISNAGLARRVNDLGAQRGLTLRYDKTSVARWVSKGMVPQGAAPHLIAAAIGSKLGRPVPLHEIGLADADPAPEVGLAFPRGTSARRWSRRPICTGSTSPDAGPAAGASGSRWPGRSR